MIAATACWLCACGAPQEAEPGSVLTVTPTTAVTTEATATPAPTAEATETPAPTATPDEPQKDELPWWMFVIVAVIAAGIGFGAAVIFAKKKK